jgi:RNA polymerase sigma-70 factor (ECF subfamily)
MNEFDESKKRMPETSAVVEGGATYAEAKLISLLRAGNEEAFVTLVDRHHESLVRLAQVFVRNETIAREVAQEAWIGVIRGLASFEARSSLKTWIFNILVNRAKTRAVRERRTSPFSVLGDDDRPLLSPDRFNAKNHWARPPDRWTDETPERYLLRREAVALARSTIDRLPPLQRAVIILRDVESHSAQEVCCMLEISDANQRVLLHRARMRVRQALEDYEREGHS